MAIIQGNAKQGSTRGFYPKVINGSLRFNDDDSAYLSWTPDATHAAGRATYTFSCWFKISGGFGSSTRPLFGAGGTTWDMLYISSGDVIAFSQATETISNFRSNAVLRDPSAWYHIVLTVDTTQATSTDRVKCWLNGELVTWSTSTYPTPQNETSMIADNVAHYIGKHPNSTAYWDGYFGDMFFISGTALTASDFGSFKNGVWVAEDYAGTFGTNGFYLTFEDDTQVEAFNTVLYRGNNGQNSITGTGLTPDFVWIKNRDSGVDYHNLYDSVRGPRRRIYSNGTNAEEDGHLVSFDSDGFTLDTNNSNVNGSGTNYVAWCWDAGANNAVTGHSSVTWTGNGSSSGQVISGLPFKPDLIWYKTRNNSYDHKIFDSVRGASNRLSSNSTAAEVSFNELKDFLPNGFSFANGDASKGNGSGENMIGWAWDAGDSDPVSNTTGDTTATVKTNGDFSIMAYSGTGAATSIGHGLSSAPNFVIVKDRSAAQNWVVWTDDINTDGNQYLELNQTSAIQSSSVFWNSTAPDASKIYLGTSNSVSGRNFIAYAWRNVTGKQKFGTYTGDGGTSNSVTTGFRPGFVMIKRTDGAANWEIYDSTRESFTTSGQLYPNTSDVEGGNHIQFDSNGFTLTANRTNTNENTATYIYAAFAGSYSDYITDYNTDGSIDSRVKASDTTGFSIVSYEGSTGVKTVGHGLSATPDFVIVKDRTNSVAFPQWWTWHSSLGTDSHLFLNLTDGGSGTGYFDTSGMSSSTIGFLSDSSGPNTTGESYIAYCWTETTGVSRFGTFTGDGNVNENIVYLTDDGTSTGANGFKPAFVMVKAASSSSAYTSWAIYDNTRDTVAPFSSDKILWANRSYQEGLRGQGSALSSSTMFDLEFLDNGFKFTSNSGGNDEVDKASTTFIYAAFADTREAAFWLDQSSNNNDWQPVNLDHNDTVADSPTNNFCTWNPLDKDGVTLSDGNLNAHLSEANYNGIRGTVAFPSTGKYYWEAEVVTIDTDDHVTIGLGTNATSLSSFLGQVATTVIYNFNDSGQTSAVYNGTSNVFTGNSTFAAVAGDVVQIAYDADNGYVWFGKNNTWADSSGGTTGNPSTGTNPTVSSVASGEYFPIFGGGDLNSNIIANFGQQPFKYDPPE